MLFTSGGADSVCRKTPLPGCSCRAENDTLGSVGAAAMGFWYTGYVIYSHRVCHYPYAILNGLSNGSARFSGIRATGLNENKYFVILVGCGFTFLKLLFQNSRKSRTRTREMLDFSIGTVYNTVFPHPAENHATAGSARRCAIIAK